MGDVSIIARRLEDGKHVQYGWSGNGGYYSNVGNRLLLWYDDPELIDYLFDFGRMRLIGKPGSEKGGESWFYTHEPANSPHWLGKSEREIFSKIAFIDYGYFYDLDKIWYYIVPGPFRIKIPLHYIDRHLDERHYEFEERNRIEQELVKYILGDYYASDKQLQSVVAEKYPQGIEKIREVVFEESERDAPCHRLWERFKEIFNYFDDWVVAKTSDDMEELTGFVLHEKQDGNRVETIDW